MICHLLSAIVRSNSRRSDGGQCAGACYPSAIHQEPSGGDVARLRRETYNIGSRNERTNIDVVEKICDLLDAKEPLGKGPRRRLITCVADRPGHDRRYVIDPAKIEGQLGWRPAHIFEQGLVKTVQWYLRNAAWWQPILERGYRTTRIGLADRFDGSGSHRKVIGAEIVSSVGMP